MINKKEINDQLKEFGLDEKQIKIYLLLLQKGILSPLEIARATQINRTTVYRILEKLKEAGLAEEVLEQHSVKARATSPEKLKMILAQREADLEQLRQALPGLIAQLSSVKDAVSSPTKVIYFRGKEGLKQLLWNILKADKRGEVGYGYLDWNESVGRKFAEKLRQERIARGVRGKELSNSALTIASKKFLYTDFGKELGKIYEEKYIPKNVLEFNHDTYIYNDVFAFVHFYKDELFGVEIYNAEIAKTQRQIFYILWEMAEKVKRKK